MNYKDEFLKAQEQIYFLSREISAEERKQERTLAILNALNAILATFIQGVDRLHGERKINAINAINAIQDSFTHIASQYMVEIYYRKKEFKLEKENLELCKRVSELEKEIEILKQIDEL